MAIEFDTTSVRFDPATGLVPAVVQDVGDGKVLMLAYMNAESLARTLETGRVTFWSRSRGRLWEKGETSGNTLQLMSIAADCDGDALLVAAAAVGPTCHTGERSCFATSSSTNDEHRLGRVLADLQIVIAERDRDRPEDSYTARLLEAGVVRTAQKVAEEGVETALAAAVEPDRLVSESADLLYHLLVLWRAANVEPVEISMELERRAGTPGDWKPAANLLTGSDG